MTCAQLLKCQTPTTLILRTPLSRMVRFCWGMLGVVSNPTHIDHFGKYHNTLCLSPTNFALFLFSLGTIVIPKRTWKQCLCKIWGVGANKEYYSISRSGLLSLLNFETKIVSIVILMFGQLLSFLILFLVQVNQMQLLYSGKCSSWMSSHPVHVVPITCSREAILLNLTLVIQRQIIIIK